MTNIQAVCELTDLEVLTDLSDTEQTSVYAIGSRPELAAGLWGCRITPWFDTMEELEKFCTQHMAKFKVMADSNAVWYVNEKGEEVDKPNGN